MEIDIFVIFTETKRSEEMVCFFRWLTEDSIATIASILFRFWWIWIEAPTEFISIAYLSFTFSVSNIFLISRSYYIWIKNWFNYFLKENIRKINITKDLSNRKPIYKHLHSINLFWCEQSIFSQDAIKLLQIKLVLDCRNLISTYISNNLIAFQQTGCYHMKNLKNVHKLFLMFLYKIYE